MKRPVGSVGGKVGCSFSYKEVIYDRVSEKMQTL